MCRPVGETKGSFVRWLANLNIIRNLTSECGTLNRLKVAIRLLTTDLEVSDESESTTMIFTEIVDNNQQSSA